jgi:diguanylate cyclase (GGDEF)-like protein
MKKPPIPPDEAQRLESLRRLAILDTPAEERFDRITRTAARLFDAPIALVTLVDASRQWFKSAQGLDLMETPRDVSFCAHALLGDEPFVVPDTKRDPRFADNPLVTGPPYVRFYAGMPLEGPEGLKLGTLCIIDKKPRTMTLGGLAALRDLAGWAESELQVFKLSQSQMTLLTERAALRDQAMTDALTRVWNHGVIVDILVRELDRSRRAGQSVAAIMADIDHFKKINDGHGHLVGDAVLREVARRIRASVRPYDAVGRYGGEEFLVILPGATGANAQKTAERIRTTIAGSEILVPGGRVAVTISLGVAATEGNEKTKADQLVSAADGALYRAKKAGRNRVKVW